MHSLAKYLIIAGIILTTAGVIIYFLPKNLPIGRLPGDIHIKRDNFSFYFPITTSILVSIVLTLIFYLINYFKR